MFDISEGPAMVCKVWDKEVRETRHKIMAAARLVLVRLNYFHSVLTVFSGFSLRMICTSLLRRMWRLTSGRPSTTR